MLNIEKYKCVILNNKQSNITCCVNDLAHEGKCITNCDECKKEALEWLLSEYKEPVLDDAEKAYLSNIITPFRNKVDYVQLCSNGITCFVRICVKYYSYRKNVEYVNLPRFEINRMYKKMEINKQYSLEELGL